jgi:non-ribosomal peptide synthase protein (TIGR01720 family)
VLLESRQSLEPPLLARAVEHLVRHHDALRLRFLPKEGGRQQVIAGSEEKAVFSRVDLSGKPEAAQYAAVESTAAELQVRLNLSQGPMIQVALFELGAHRPARLLIIIHHLAVDGISWRILLEDLQLAYQQLSRREKVQLPPKTTSFQAWAKRLTDAARSGMFQPELEYWLEACRSETPSLPVDYPGGANTEASARTVSGSLTAEETRALLLEVPGAYRTQINDVLLTALLQAFSRWTGARSMTVDLEGHGREGILENVDLSRTVGWFTTIFPVFLELERTSDPGRALKSVKEQLRRIPNRGIGYGVLRYLSAGTACGRRLRALPQAEVSFNYLGRFDQVLSETALFRWGRESRGPSRSPNGLRSHLLAINGVVRGNRLRMDWTYSGNFHRGKTIERLAQDFMEALRSLITHCVSPTAGGFTPSDFPEAGLSQEDLDSLITELHEPAPEDLHDQTEY